MISKTERAELRTLVRARFKVLRRDVEVRQRELESELRERIGEHFAAEDTAWDRVFTAVDEAVQAANRAVNDAIRTMLPEHRDRRLVTCADMQRPTHERTSMYRSGVARIESQVAGAMRQLDRQEADLLTRLVVDTLESEEARQFLAQVPTVGSLVPADRLLELTTGPTP